MSGLVKPSLISAIAECIDITSLSTEAASVLAPDVEYKVREILQDALKFARHARRAKLQTADINHALQVRDIEQLYGFDSKDRRRYAQLAGAPDTFEIQDTLHKCEDIIYEPLPPPPREGGFNMHWFLIGGVKPRIPENAVPRTLLSEIQAKVQARRQQPSAPAAPVPEQDTVQGEPSDVQPVLAQQQETHGILDKDKGNAAFVPVARHIISEELSELVRVFAEVLSAPPAEDNLSHPIFAIIATDCGLNQIVPYLVNLIASEVSASTHNLRTLWRLLKSAHALVLNHNNNLGAYLFQLLPAIMTCLLCGKLGPPRCDHWHLRRAAAQCLRNVVLRFPQPQLSLVTRISSTCVEALLKKSKPLSTHYGAVVGIAAMGPRAVRLLLLPNLPMCYNRLGPILMQSSKLMKQMEARQCLGVLQLVACEACRQMLLHAMSAGVTVTALAQLKASADAPAGVLALQQRKQASRARAASVVDEKLKELEQRAGEEKAKQVQWQLQHAQEAQQLEAITAMARAEVDGVPPEPAASVDVLRDAHHSRGDGDAAGLKRPRDGEGDASGRNKAAHIGGHASMPVDGADARLLSTALTQQHSVMDTDGPGSPVFVPPPESPPSCEPASTADTPAPLANGHPRPDAAPGAAQAASSQPSQQPYGPSSANPPAATAGAAAAGDARGDSGFRENTRHSSTGAHTTGRASDGGAGPGDVEMQDAEAQDARAGGPRGAYNHALVGSSQGGAKGKAKNGACGRSGKGAGNSAAKRGGVHSVWSVDKDVVDVLQTQGQDVAIAGHLDALYEMFGEAVLPWVPLSQLDSVFL